MGKSRPPLSRGHPSKQKSRRSSDEVSTPTESEDSGTDPEKEAGAGSDEFLPAEERLVSARTRSKTGPQSSSPRVTRSSLRYFPTVEIPYSPRQRWGPGPSSHTRPIKRTRFRTSDIQRGSRPVSSSNMTPSFRLCNKSDLHSEVPQSASSKGPETSQSLLLPLLSDEFTIEAAFHEWRGATFAVLNHFATNMSSTDASYVRQLIVSQNLLLDQEMKHHDRKRSFLRLMGQELDRIILRNADAVDKS